MNHEMSGDRTFHLAGDSTNYYIQQKLEETSAGTLNIAGRTQDKKDTIIATSDTETTKGLSMFEVVYDDTKLNIKDVTIQSAYSENGGSVIYQNNNDSTVKVSNTTIWNNSTVGDGGAVSVNSGTAAFDDVTFSGNSADRAGALRVSGGRVAIIDSEFTNNTATRYGGAIATPHSANDPHSKIKLTIDGTTFSENKVTSNSNSGGGAISLGDNITAIIAGSTFRGNSSATNGGAVYNESSELTMDVVSFENNEAQRGSAIYNLGTATLTDATFSGNSKNYIYNGQGSNLIITSALQNYILTNSNVANSTITNAGTLNLTSAQNIADSRFTLADALSGGTVNTSGNVIFDNLVSGSAVYVTNGTLAINGTGTDVNNALSNVSLYVQAGTTATLGNKNIYDGTINVAAATAESTVGIFNINNSQNIEISSDLTGGGNINKTGSGTVDLTGHDNDGFVGDLNITQGTVRFTKTPDNTFFGSDAEVNVDGLGSTFAYVSSEPTRDYNGSFANITLNNGGTVSISGAGRDASTAFTLNNGWLTSTGTTANKIIFSDASYILNTLYTHTEGNINDNITFNSSDITLGAGITGSEITDSRRHDVGARDYDMTGANYTLTNSNLDLSNRVAGDNYIFDKLVADGDSSGIALDVNLYLEHDDNNQITVAPFADTITAGAGSSGIVEITKLYITDDNGAFITDADDNLTKGVIQVFKGEGNQLKVAEANNAQILSWATNLYRYGVTAAQTERDADSIEITPDGLSSTDTLRDMNIYNSEGGGGNRGFSFIAENGLQENNNYNIYRDLDTTSAGNFTVVGTLAAKSEGGERVHKSVLSGQLQDLVLYASESSDNLRQINDTTWEYNGEQFDSTYISSRVINPGTPDEDIEYTIQVEAFTPEDQTNGSMFEIVNATNFEMTNVAVQYAKRYAADDIKDGSVIYAKNKDANIFLDNVDFINNSVDAGNGGAVANILSKEFSLTNSIISGNTASGNGGAIYNTSLGMTIANATADGNKSSGGLGGAIYTSANMQISDSNFGTTTLNTHRNGEQNDIYIGGTATLAFVTSDNTTSTINSGIAGSADSTFNKTGAGTLNLNGNNEDFAGTFDISAGSVLYTADDENDTFVGGSVRMNQGTTLTMDIDSSSDIKTQIIQNVSGGGDGSGGIIKNGAGTLKLLGANSGFGGSTTINGGSIVYRATDSSNSYFGGSTNLAGAGTNLTLIVDDGVKNQTVSRISGVASSTINKQGEGDLNLSGDNSAFYGVAYVENGKLVYVADDETDEYFGGNTNIFDGAELEANVAQQGSDGSHITDQTIGNIIGGADAKFTKTGDGKIQLTGDNEFSGTTTITEGILAYTSGIGNYVDGSTVIKENGTLEYTVNTGSDKLTAVSGNGAISKHGDGQLNLVGDNSGFTGSAMIADGILAYTTAKDSAFIKADEYMIADGAELLIENTENDIVNVSNLTEYVDENNVSHGYGTVHKTGASSLNLGGQNAGFEGTIDIDAGSVTFNKTDSTSYN